MPQLEVRNLTKRYGKTVAVDDLSFAVEAGHATGFLGPNGSGKTTTMRALLGLLRPTRGEALILGVLAITTEFRHGTTGSTFLVSPRRYPVLVAKLAAMLLLGLLAGVAFVVVNGGLALPLFSARGVELPATSDLVSIYAGVGASFALLCAFGLGVGAIVRNQVSASSPRSPPSSSSPGCPNCCPATSASTSQPRRSALCTASTRKGALAR
jgi:energy-coupling factor transporter ATP-binding protein EcfA2